MKTLKTHAHMKIPLADEPNSFLEVPLDTIDVSMSEQLRIDSRNPNQEPLRGLDVPSQIYMFKMSKMDKERWTVVFEELMGKGFEDTKDLARITNLEKRTCRHFRQAVLDRWSSQLTTGQINIRRERLYGQAQFVLDECIKEIKNAETPKVKVAFIKMALEAQKRQAALIGAEKIHVEVEQQTQKKHLKEKDYDQLALEHNLEVDDLKVIGKILSKKGVGNG